MKHYFVIAHFKNDQDVEFTKQFDFFSDYSNFLVTNEALALIFDDLDIDGLKEFCEYDLSHFSITTF